MNFTPRSDIATEKLIQIIDRIECLEEEKCVLISDIKDIYAEKKSYGFETKIMWQVNLLHAMNRYLLSEQDALLDTY